MTLEELQIKFTADMGNVNAQLNGLRGQLSGVAGGTVKAGSGFKQMAKMASMVAGSAVAVKLVQFGKESLEMANNVVESENLFGVSMGKMESKAREWSDTMGKNLGLNPYELRKNVGMMNTMLGSMGMSEDQAYDMSTGMVTLAQDMASFYNLSTEDAFAKLQAGITGEAEPLKRLGILVNEETIAEYAMRKGISKTGKELTSQQKTLARYGVIMEQTTKAQGDLARTADSPTNQLRKLNNQLDQAKVSIGMALQPALIAILPTLNSAATGFATFLSSVVGNGNASDAFGDVAVSVEDATEIVSSRVSSAATELAGKVRAAKAEVDAALTAWAEAAKITKEIILNLTLTPMTTGLERIGESLVLLQTDVNNMGLTIQSSVLALLNAAFASGAIDEGKYNTEKTRLQGLLDTAASNTTALRAEIQAMIDAALADGYLDDSEREAILGRLKTGAEALVPTYLEIEKIAEATIRAQLAAGKISQADADIAIAGIRENTRGAIAGIQAVTTQIGIEVEMMPTTTGEWRLSAYLIELSDELKNRNLSVQTTVTAYLDALYQSGAIDKDNYDTQKADLDRRVQEISAAETALNTKIAAMVNAAMEDGIVDDSEKAGILEELRLGAEGLIPQYLALEKVALAQVDAMAVAGLIAPESVEGTKADIRAITAEQIGVVTGARAKVEVMLMAADFSVKTLSGADLQALKDAITEELGASASLLVSAQGVINTLFPSSSGIDSAVRAVFAQAISTATEMSLAIQGMLSDAFKDPGIATAEWLENLASRRKEYAQATAFAAGTTTKGTAFEMALFEMDELSAESMTNLTKAYTDAALEAKAGAKEVYATKISATKDPRIRKSLEAEVSKREGRQVTYEEIVQTWQKELDDAIAEEQNAYLSDMIGTLGKRVPSKGTVGKEAALGLMESFQNMLAGVDLTTATPEIKAGLADLYAGLLASMTPEALAGYNKTFTQGIYKDYPGWQGQLIGGLMPEGIKLSPKQIAFLEQLEALGYGAPEVPPEVPPAEPPPPEVPPGIPQGLTPPKWHQLFPTLFGSGLSQIQGASPEIQSERINALLDALSGYYKDKEGIPLNRSRIAENAGMYMEPLGFPQWLIDMVQKPAEGTPGAKTIDFTGVSAVTMTGANVTLSGTRFALPLGMLGIGGQAQSKLNITVGNQPLYASFNISGQQFQSMVVEALRTATATWG